MKRAARLDPERIPLEFSTRAPRWNHILGLRSHALSSSDERVCLPRRQHCGVIEYHTRKVTHDIAFVIEHRRRPYFQIVAAEARCELSSIFDVLVVIRAANENRPPRRKPHLSLNVADMRLRHIILTTQDCNQRPTHG